MAQNKNEVEILDSKNNNTNCKDQEEKFHLHDTEDDDEVFLSNEDQKQIIKSRPRERRVSDIIGTLNDLDDYLDHPSANVSTGNIPVVPRSPGAESGYSGTPPATGYMHRGKLPESPRHRFDHRDALPYESEQASALEEETSENEESIKEARMTTDPHAFKYNMSHARRGQCIVFNHDKFENSSLNKRDGSDKDVDSILYSFQKLEFEVTVYDNLCVKEIKEILEKASKLDHSDSDCLAVVLLTHGLVGDYVHAHDHPYPLQDIWRPFTADKCPSLAGKPKLFFIQACRGEKLDKGVKLSRTEVDSAGSLNNEMTSYKIPTYGDFLFSQSTMEGYAAWRNPSNGTWYIQSLCSVLNKYGTELEITQLLTRTSLYTVLYHESFHEKIPWQNGLKQSPCFNSILSREVYFRPKKKE